MQPPVQPPALNILIEPGAQARPLPQQRLVGNLDTVAVDGEEPVVRERLERGTGVTVVLVRYLGDGDTAAQTQVTLLPGVAQPQQQATHRSPHPSRQRRVSVLCHASERPVHAARCPVTSEGERPALPALPRLGQRRGQQRQCPGSPCDVGNDHLDHSGFDLEAGTLGGELDGAPQLGVAHGTHEDVVAREAIGELRVRGASTEMIGADGEHQCRVGLVNEIEQTRDELALLAAVSAGGERLLELVDEYDSRPPRGVIGPVEEVGQGLGGVAAWGENRRAPSLAARQRPDGQSREQPRPHQRGLAAAGGADDGEQAGLGQAGDQLGDEPLAAEEVGGVGLLEPGQALVGAAPEGRDRARL